MSPAPAPAKPKVDPGTKPSPTKKPGKKTWSPTKPLVAPRPKAFHFFNFRCYSKATDLESLFV